MASPYFDSSSKQLDESKVGLLKAVADAGEQGKQAFDQAQAQAAQARQDAVARAQDRSYLGIGGDNQTFLGAYDARVNQAATNRANFESGLAQTRASNESYLEKARSSIPALEMINRDKASAQEATIKAALEQARIKAEQEAAEKAASEQRTIDRENRAEQRTIDRENRAAERAAAKEAKPNNQGLLGLAAQAVKGSVNPAVNAGAAGPVRPGETAARTLPDRGLTDLAAETGRQLGVSDAKIAEMYAPGFQNTLSAAVQKPEQLLAQTQPDIKWLTSNVRGMDTKKAQQALQAPEFREAGNQVASYFSIAPLDEDGNIADESPYTGLSPREALRRYIYSQPGNLTMKDAVMQYYGKMLPS